jgi:acetolactate synthase-1/2/3 large subunit
MEISGSRMVVEALKREGIDTVFGYPGGAIMNVYDELYKQDDIKHVLTRHEQAAIHAAEGFAKVTGEVGVAIVTSGPGFTNAVTGLADAYMDSVPIVVISGQVPMALIGTDAFQEIDAVGISRACTKHNYLVTDAKDLPRVIKEAFYIARSGRPGPVHVDIPKDVSAQITEFVYPDKAEIPTYNPAFKGDLEKIKNAVEAIKSSKRPLLYVGGGVVQSNSGNLVREFAEKTGIPAVETLMARGVMGSTNPLLISMVGMHGSYAANIAMSEADLLISFGPRFDMVVRTLWQPLLVGSEQFSYWHSSLAKVEGSQNLSGIENQKIDSLIEKIGNSENFIELQSLVFELDRELLKNFYVIPHWHIDKFRVAYWKRVHRPEISPLYDLNIENWWFE